MIWPGVLVPIGTAVAAVALAVVAARDPAAQPRFWQRLMYSPKARAGVLPLGAMTETAAQSRWRFWLHLALVALWWAMALVDDRPWTSWLMIARLVGGLLYVPLVALYLRSWLLLRRRETRRSTSEADR